MRVEISYSPEMNVFVLRPPGKMGRVFSEADIAPGGIAAPLASLFQQAKEAVLAGKAASGVHIDLPDPAEELNWQTQGDGAHPWQSAVLGLPLGGDGVFFTLVHQPTCYRRGPWKLLIEVADGVGHHHWGCFDDQDQPMRYYHQEATAKSEAALIAAVLLRDRLACGPAIGDWDSRVEAAQCP